MNTQLDRHAPPPGYEVGFIVQRQEHCVITPAGETITAARDYGGTGWSAARALAAAWALYQADTVPPGAVITEEPTDDSETADWEVRGDGRLVGIYGKFRLALLAAWGWYWSDRSATTRPPPPRP